MTTNRSLLNTPNGQDNILRKYLSSYCVITYSIGFSRKYKPGTTEIAGEDPAEEDTMYEIDIEVKINDALGQHKLFFYLSVLFITLF